MSIERMGIGLRFSQYFQPNIRIKWQASYGKRVEWWLLALVLAGGLALRTWNINFDQGVGSHPDERSTACFVAPMIGLPQSWEEFWNPQQSRLNPLWNRDQGERRGYTYGHLPLYLGVGMGEAMHRAAPVIAPVAQRAGLSPETIALWERANRACDGIAVAGRFTIALLDTLTILLVFLVARIAFFEPTVVGRRSVNWIALLASAFYAFTAQAIQLSHFFAMDPASTTFTVLAVLGGVYMVRYGTYGGAALCGVGAGLAVAAKFSALPILAVPVAAGVLVYWRAGRAGDGMARGRPVGNQQFFAITGVIWAMVVALVSFAVTSPYAILDWQSFIQATLIEQGRMVRGVADLPYTRQYRDTTPYLYFIEQQLAWGMWWPLGVTALVGSVAALGLLARTLLRLGRDMLGRERAQGGDEYSLGVAWPAAEITNVVVWAWVLPYFAITGAFLAKFNRYMSPILPFAALFAAGLVWAIGQQRQRTVRAQEPSAPESNDPPVVEHERTAGKRTPIIWRRGLAIVLAVVALGGSVFWSAAYVNGVYGGEHTWITASRWVYENASRGSVILWEVWDDPLPLHALPDDPQRNMGAAGLSRIDWSPYEEDTHDKYLIMRERLREADFVAYSSKRIYGSVVKLPERYPMTIRYYEGMWDGSLGFEVAVDVTSPPRLFGWIFEDHHADESWSLYDHPRATVFRKVRELSDAEFDAYFDAAWETAIPYYRGEDSFLSPFLEVIGLGRSPGSEQTGLIGRIVTLLTGEGWTGSGEAGQPEPNLMLNARLADLPIVDNYRWNDWASAEAWRAAVAWWGALGLLGLIVWPLVFRVSTGLRDRGYLMSRSIGWLAAGWLLWMGASTQIWHNTVRNAWVVVGALALIGVFAGWQQRRAMLRFLRDRWPVLLVGEGLFLLAFALFIQFRLWNPDLWQPWHGGEKFMEFAFLNGILRSPSFPPVNPHFAGGYINYYYYGLYLVAYVIKLTGIYAEVAFNLAVASLFALTALNAFAVAYNAVGEPIHIVRSRVGGLMQTAAWRPGIGTGLLAAAFVVGIGNLEGFAQLLRNVMRADAMVEAQGVFGFVSVLASGLWRLALVLVQGGALPAYNFWDPSRVIPHTINEFPYWTFLFADLHPHMIGIPFTLVFLGAALQLLRVQADQTRLSMGALGVGAVGLAFILGALASINLWEYPTYLGLALAVFLLLVVARRVSLAKAMLAWIVLAGLSYLMYLPFFQYYAGIGASGIGLVREPDGLGEWLLIWGFFVFVLLGWSVWRLAQRPIVGADPRVCPYDNHLTRTEVAQELGLSRLARMIISQFDRLPRMIHLCRILLRQQTFGFLLGLGVWALLIVAAVAALLTGSLVLAICLLGMALSAPLLLRANIEGELSTVFAALVTFAGFALLGGTQVLYVRDFLQGGDSYRMNTLFKFFIQVWVMWGVGAAIAFVQVWRATAPGISRWRAQRGGDEAGVQVAAWPIGIVWRTVAVFLLAVSLAYPLFGTPARLSQRMVGWRPPVGTLDGMAFMEQGSYTWPDDSHRIELSYDYDAIQWLLANVRGNLVIVESAEVGYYRAGGTRVASFTGLSGLMGFHEGEQRPGRQVGQRHGLMREFWDTSDIARTVDIAHELDIALVYVGQLEEHQHELGVEKIRHMAEMGMLTLLYENERSAIYAFPERLVYSEAGYFVPASGAGDVG